MTLSWANIVTAQIETSCSTSYDLTTIGGKVEAEIKAELDVNGLDTNPQNVSQSGVGLLVTAAQAWLCRDIRILQKHDQTIPNAIHEGTLGIDVTIDASIKFYADKGREALDKYIAAMTGTNEDDTGEIAGLLALAGEEL
jgi:hypothetical protein